MPYTPDELAILVESQAEYLGQHHIRANCQLVSFVSRSKGKGRKRPFPSLVELLRYGSRCYQLKDGWFSGLDVIAREVTGSDNATAFLDRLRSLERMAQ